MPGNRLEKREGLILLAEAQAAGLTVEADGDPLVVRGPKSAERLAQLLLRHKAQVMTVLDGGSAVGEEKTSPLDKKSITKVAEDDIAKAGEMAMITGELMITAGEMPSEAPEQPPGQEVAPPSLSLPRTTAGVLWPAALADWDLLLQPCDLPVQFMLQEGVQVVDSGRFLGWLQRDVRTGTMLSLAFCSRTSSVNPQPTPGTHRQTK